MPKRRIVRFLRTSDGLRAANQWLKPRVNYAESVVIGATRAAAYEFARELPVKGTLGLHCMTLIQAAEELARSKVMAEQLGPLSRLGAEAVAARVVHRLDQAGKLTYFAPVAKLPGFPAALALTLSDLRLGQVHPASLDPSPGELNRKQLQAEEGMLRLEETIPFGEIQHRTRVIAGDAVDVISSAIEREHPDLLVLGTHSRGAVKKMVLGSVAERALRVASCPVLTVGAHVAKSKPNAASFTSILFAADFGPPSTRAFTLALSLAEECGAKLVLLHMIPPMTFVDIGYAGYGSPSYRPEDHFSAAAVSRFQSRSNFMKRDTNVGAVCCVGCPCTLADILQQSARS